MFVSILTYNMEHKINILFNFYTVSFFHVSRSCGSGLLWTSVSPLMMLLKLTQSFFSPLAVPDSVVITFYLPVKAGEVLIGKQWEPIYLFPPFDPMQVGEFQILLLCRPPVLPSTHMHMHMHTRHNNANSSRKVNMTERKMQRSWRESISLSAIHSRIHAAKSPSERGKKEKTLKQAIISRKVNIVRRCCLDTFVVRTFETKRVSKQVKSARTQCLPFHVLPPPRRGLISRCCISRSVTNTMRCLAASKAHLWQVQGGKDQIFIFKTQSGNLNETKWK